MIDFALKVQDKKGNGERDFMILEDSFLCDSFVLQGYFHGLPCKLISLEPLSLISLSFVLCYFLQIPVAIIFFFIPSIYCLHLWKSYYLAGVERRSPYLLMLSFLPNQITVQNEVCNPCLALWFFHHRFPHDPFPRSSIKRQRFKFGSRDCFGSLSPS